MPTCPRCQQPLKTETVQCPYCQMVVKAYGHKGIPLHYAQAGEYLCDRCLYHLDNSCNFPQRPFATSCTLFRDQNQPMETLPAVSFWTKLKRWFRRYQGLLLLIGIILISLYLAL